MKTSSSINSGVPDSAQLADHASRSVHPVSAVIYTQILTGFLSRSHEVFQRFAENEGVSGAPLALNIISDRHFNASASKAEEDTISINSGVFVILWNLYNLIMSGSEHFPTVGQINPRSSLSEIGKIDGNFFDVLYNDGKLMAQPEDTVRQAVAFYMFRSSLDFIFLRELGHIWSGHLEFLQSQGRLHELSETLHMLPEPFGENDLQIFEMEADHFANRELMQLVAGENYFYAVGVQFLWPRYERDYGKGASAVLLALTAVSCVFRIFDEEKWQTPDIRTGTHPPWQVREFVCAGSQTNILKRWFKRGEVLMSIRANFSATEVFRLLGKDGHAPLPEAIDLLKRAGEYIRKINKRRMDIHPALESLRKGPSGGIALDPFTLIHTQKPMAPNEGGR